MRRTLATLALLASACLAAPAHGQPDGQWLRRPAISPDGSRIAFQHGGDIYVVAATGGRAIPLTLDDAWDGHPVWSPDGTRLAFASDRHGSLDVFVMDAEGGPATRLSWYSGNDVPTGFHPDGGRVLFVSSRIDAPQNRQFPSGALPELYSVSLEGGTPRQLLTTPALEARYSDDGRRLLYEDARGYEDEHRKHHTSSIARDLWVVELEGNDHTRLTGFEGEDRDPEWAPGGEAFYFLSERAGDMNVFRQPLDPAAPAEQLTRFEHHPVRHLSVGGDGTLVFSWHGGIYRLAPGGEPARVPVEIRVDRQEPPVDPEALGRGISEFAVSPDGKEVAFVARGEVFASSVDFRTTRRITDTPEQERSVSFSPDGRAILYAGERGGSWNVYQAKLGEGEDYFFAATRVVEEPVVATGEEEFQPRFSPDGSEVAYLAERTVLKVVDLASGRVRTVMGGEHNYSYSDGDQWFDWSPDGEWFVVGFVANGNWYSDGVGLVDADGGDPVDLSRSGYSNIRPRFAMGGEAVVFASDRYGERSHGSWGSEYDVMGAFLTRDAWDRFRRDKEERALREGRGGGDDEEGEVEEAGEDEPAPLQFELEGLAERTERLTLHASDLGDFLLTPDASALLYLARFEDGYDLWARDFVEEETKLLVKLGADAASMALAEDGKSLFVLADGQLKKVGLEQGPGKAIAAGKTDAIAVQPTMVLRHAAEREYLFEHIWRQVAQKFYDPQMHGLDWGFYKGQYAPKVAGVHHNRDFAELLSEMLGELNASHTGCFYRGGGDPLESTSFLGFIPDPGHEGEGVRIAELFARGPLAEAGLGVAPEAIVVAIDGEPVGPSGSLERRLAGREGRRTRVTLREGRDERDVVVRPIGGRELYELRYDRWVRANREAVDELSGGRLAYIHLRGMNDASFREAFSELFGPGFNKEAVVVDTRFNGGGWLHDDLLVLLSGEQYTDFLPRNQAAPGQRLRGEPGDRWQKPSVVVMSESNYSDAHFFPWAYKELGVGPTVGMPVPGTATAVWWERLHTGDLVFGIPQIGILDLDDDSYLENAQLEPDFRVELGPEDAAAGRDPQLEKAVEVLLDLVD